MNNSKSYRKYAEECRRLAKQMKPEHRAALMEIAEAWIRCAEEAEGKVSDGDSDDAVWHQDAGIAGGRCNEAERPPPGAPSRRYRFPIGVSSGASKRPGAAFVIAGLSFSCSSAIC